MAIGFNEIPTTLRVPFVAVEIDASNAAQGPALLAYRALLIGQKLAAGSAAADTAVKCTSVAQAITLAGRGSMLHRMAVAWFKANQVTELWLGVLADDGAAVSASGTITVTGTATAAGTIVLYVGGQRVTVAVANGDAQNDIAAAIETAIDAELDLPVTASVTTNVVTVTARNGGTSGNDIDIRHSHQEGEALPAGVSLAIVAMASGATNPSLTNLIAALGDTWYQVWAHPYTDATNLGAIETELASRFGPMRMIDGVAITSAAGSLATLTTLGNGRNSPHSAIVAQPGESHLTPPFEVAAEVAAVVTFHAQIDPARPFQTLSLAHSRLPDETDWFTLNERNLLLFDGIATTRPTPSFQIERLITTYQTNAAGADDTAYLDVTTLLTLLYLRYSLRTLFQTKFPRHKLADDGAFTGPGQFVVTPKIARAAALDWFSQMRQLGLVEGAEAFETNLVVERDVSDQNRLNMIIPPDLMNQLVVSAARLDFRL